ncbi:UNVERIFIED_CONTAM: hypothetical protein FKN15_002365 [Acipenser sinensis]
MGSVDKAEPMQVTPAEGPEGEEEQPLPEQEMPRAPVSVEETDSAPEASVGSADNAEPMQAEEREAAGGELPVAATRLGTASGSIRGKRKAQARLPTCARKCTRTGLTVGVPEGAKEGPQKRKRPPRRPPSTGTATEGEMDPSPEAVRGYAETAEPMEEAPAERPEGREEPAMAEEALPATQQTSEAGPDCNIEGPAAAEVAEGAWGVGGGRRAPPARTRAASGIPLLRQRGFRPSCCRGGGRGNTP